MLHVGPFEVDGGALRVSAPELALLEMLSEVGFHQPSQEAPGTWRKAATTCTGVKTARLRLHARLRLQLGRELARPWVSRSFDGLLVLKP